MSSDPVPSETTASPWAGRRMRAEELRARHPFAAEVLTLYLALLEVQEEAWSAVCESPPHPGELPRWAAARVLPAVVEATVAEGPAALREAVRSRIAGADHDGLAGWLAGAELDPVDRYLARASLAPVLEALGERAGTACAPGPGGDGGLLCPCCGGPPQLSYLAASGESLVSGGRSLLCARCGSSWSCSRSVCPACGETDEARLAVYAERWEGPVSGNGKGHGDARPVFPHLRIAGCSTCSRYLIEIDMERDARAVPEVDELAALPLDLYAADEGLTKVTPNLMGF
ncbi:MAG: formate dehydrogenase accessory protein FdhE [Thermoleophilaceae bacterium]|nr:formate dehydrogenase accessory protein FdhE [Thermoleophilaceae bacterium]